MSKSKKLKLAKKRQKFNNLQKMKEESKVNEFELHKNRVKHNVLGRKINKNEVGKPGESRSRAVTLRKNTLLQEYVRRHKTGKGIEDRRIKDVNGGVFARKASIVNARNWNEDEKVVLTHRGRELSEDNEYDGIDEDEDEDLLEQAEYIEKAHFGGGNDGSRGKTANEMLNEYIREKKEKQAAREANIELTEKLDEDWSAIKNLLRHKGVQQEMNEGQSDKNDYDLLVRQLKFDCNKPSEISKGNSLAKNEGLETKLKEEKEKNRVGKKDASSNSNDNQSNLHKRDGNQFSEPIGIASKYRPLPFMLPMFEPKLFDHHKNSLDEKKKLAKKVKREFKGAQRELRKDATFMKKVWIDEIKEKDIVRKNKMKELMQDLSVQQNQANQYKKKKN